MGQAQRGVSAAEVEAERARLMQDPEYRAKVERVDAERAERRRRMHQAEQPVLDDLTAAGIVVDSVWSLYKFPDMMPQAIPILIEHLSRDYPAPVLDGMGCALATRASRPWWAELKALYLGTNNETARDRLGATLSECATKIHYYDLLSFLSNERLGETRCYFLRPINRIGNRIAANSGRAIVALLASDPVLGTEANAILAGRGPND